MSRPTFDEYFLGIAAAAATRSDCERSKVGAVVVRDRRVRSTGYNGAPVGRPGCLSCPRRLSNCEPGSSYDTGPSACVALHAEQNAIIYSDRHDLPGSTIYITRAPCDGCLKLIRGAQIGRVVWPEGEMKP
ncbi:deoxycytidylate deaminase [Gordonia phage Aphelion]|uniref:Deoxycytidylate deaminase n=1 Tax=Gordonia phage Aphelion TaxID=2507860 RepID=A0A410TDD8_9CAUD|nr:deoxycytidylate deaminase [Gordonia phage Aphelion]WKW85981.1 deoxycytidylate deaminase [Gordonia Phage PhinkBoden]